MWLLDAVTPLKSVDITVLEESSDENEFNEFKAVKLLPLETEAVVGGEIEEDLFFTETEMGINDCKSFE